MDEGKKPKRVRRSFTDEFKAGAVRLVLDEGKTVCGVARDLDLTASALRVWVERARAERSNGKTGLTSEERVELAKLRKEVRELRMERETLEKPRPFRERAALRFVFIHAEKANYPLGILCCALKVSGAGCYAWRQRPL